MMLNFDVAVIGGGIAGAMAAVAAARAGKKVILVEKYGFLGGMLTAAGVGPMMTFHAGDRQVVRGLTGELIDRLKAKHLSPGHLVDTTGYTFSVTPFDAEGMKRELDLMCMEAGVELLFHAQLVGVRRAAGRIAAVTVAAGGHRLELAAAVFVDATGDANIAALAGVPTTKGRPEDGRTQPMTMNVKFSNVDIDVIRRFIKSHPEEFPRLKDNLAIIDRAERLSIGGFAGILKRAREAGEITFPREDVLFFETNTPGEVIVNTSRIIDLDPTDPFELSRAEIEGRRQAEELIRFMRRRIPGFEHAAVVSSGPQVGVRSSRQLVGLYTIAVDDILAARKFPDAVVCNAYPIDIHSSVPGEASRHAHLAPGEYYTIPYRALVNADAANLIVAGRSISGEFAAQAAFRTTPCVGAIGHAAGAAAALAAAGDGDCRQGNYAALKALLLEQGAFLP